MDTVGNAVLGILFLTLRGAGTLRYHKLSNVEKSPPASAQDARDLVARRVDNGLEALRNI